MMILELIVKVLSAAGGLIGTGLGIYNFVHARRKESREREEKASAHQEQEEEWQLLASLTEASREGLVFQPEIGSPEYRRAERLVERNKLERLPRGVYAIPGQSFKIGIDRDSSTENNS